MTLCGCIHCQHDRFVEFMQLPLPSTPGWRYACEFCGNKRCPHHSDHTLVCTNSNALGQSGSIF